MIYNSQWKPKFMSEIREYYNDPNLNNQLKIGVEEDASVFRADDPNFDYQVNKN